MDLKTVLAIPSAIIVTVGGLFTAESYVAKDSELQLVAMRLEQKIISDKADSIQEMLWKLEDRNRGRSTHEWPSSDLDRYRRLEKELKRLEKERRTQ